MKLSKRSIYIILVIILTIAVDQISKIIVRTQLEFEKYVNILDESFRLIWVENPGAFLGMGSELNGTLRIILLIILPILVLGFVLRHIFKDKSLDNWSLFAFASIIGGGIANVFDRIAFGKVTDFLLIDLGGVFRTGIFNLADLSVTTGMVILVFMSFKNRKSSK